MFVFEGDVLVEYFLNWNSKNNKSPLDHEIPPQFILKISSAIQLLELVFMAFSFNKKQICEHDVNMTPFLSNTKNNIHFACSAYPTVSFFTFEARNLIQIILDTYHVSTVFIGTTKTGWKKNIILRPKRRSSCFD